MLAKTGLLVLSNPNYLGKIMPSLNKEIGHTLYIQLISAISEPLGTYQPNVAPCIGKYSNIIKGIYTQAATHCENIDVRVLLSNLKYNAKQINTKEPIDVIIFDKNYTENDIENFVNGKIANIAKGYKIITLNSEDKETIAPEDDASKITSKSFKHGVIGGTFDRLHSAHKLLLSETALRSDEKITIGITDEQMIKNKILWELVQDFDTRFRNVEGFVKDICPELTWEIVPISDPFGPSITDDTMDLIVVSEETIKGGEKINEIRKNKKMNELHIFPVELIDEPNPGPNDESKISSSNERRKLLGKLIKPVTENHDVPRKPYVIGLTGGIASGKSGISEYLNEFGAKVINCDLVGHGVYKKGKPCYESLVSHFGKEIVGEDGEIDRRVLGSIVFKDTDALKTLNSLVWPAIHEEVKNMARTSDKPVVVIEAAVLIQASWTDLCHEVWTSIITREEAIARLKQRNLTEEQALQRIDAQPLNAAYVNAANVVFCTLWSKDITKNQVKRAWDSLKERMFN